MRPHRLIGVGLTAAGFALTAALYPRLPDPMPTHVALPGRVGGFVAKPVGPFVMPLIGLVAYAVTAVKLSRGASAHRLYVVPIAVAALFLFMIAVSLRASLGDAPGTTQAMTAGTGLFLAVVGNYFGKLRRNRWIGIRTPWTLADDEVWLRTHRLGGPLVVAGGLASFAAALAGAPARIAMAPIIGAALVSCIYSYLVYRRLRAPGVSS